MQTSSGLEMIRDQNTWTPSSCDTGQKDWGVSALNCPTPDQKRPSVTPTDTSFSSSAPCHYEGKHFTLGESWLRKDCFHCTCLHPVGVGCCDT